MNTTKINKILHLLLITFYSFATYGSTPKDIINEYINKKTLTAPGNVLAYHNHKGQVIVLKSGNDYTTENLDMEQEAIIIPLEDVLSLVNLQSGISHTYETNEQGIKQEENFSAKASTPNITNYCDLIANHQKGKTSWEAVIRGIYEKDKYKGYFDGKRYQTSKEINKISDFFNAIKNDDNKNLMSRLKQIRHTEFQVAAIYQAYLEHQENEILKLLLPACLIEEDVEVETQVCSLFEACNSCRHADWLQNKKENFVFKLLDGQIQMQQDACNFYHGKLILNEFMSQNQLTDENYAY